MSTSSFVFIIVVIFIISVIWDNKDKKKKEKEMKNTEIFLQDKMIRMDLVKIRKSKGLTQQQVAEKSGLSISTISNIESGDNSYTTRSLIMYAEALGYDIRIKKKEF